MASTGCETETRRHSHSTLIVSTPSAVRSTAAGRIRSHWNTASGCTPRADTRVCPNPDRLHHFAGHHRLSAMATAPLAVYLLILRLGDGVLDPASPHVAAIPARAVRLIAAHVVRVRPRVTAAWTRNSNTFQNRDQLWRGTLLSGSDQHSQWAATAATRQMKLRCETTPGPAECLTKAMFGRTAPAPQHPGHSVMSPGRMLTGTADG